jgi:transaldolase
MPASINSLLATGTRLYLDSIDPQLVRENVSWGATGATSNPIIISNLIKTGRFDEQLVSGIKEGLSDDDIAWKLTDQLVADAQEQFSGIWLSSGGDQGWVSFELDPLIEDPENGLPIAARVSRYISLGRKWSAGHTNRMIKVPATEAGLLALEELAAAGITLNVTLIFSERQYVAARDAIWRGAQRRESLNGFKSVYSIFVSRIDQYCSKVLPDLPAKLQGMVGIYNAKRLWKLNQDFWKGNPTRLKQELIFASTGTKDPKDIPWKYVAALAGSDIQTNPPETNKAIADAAVNFTAEVKTSVASDIAAEMAQTVNMAALEATLMAEGVAKFVEPQKKLLALIAEKRAAHEA